MEERAPNITNKNRKRKRLKVKENSRKNQARKIQELKKKDKKFKLLASSLCFLVVLSLAVSAFLKQRSLQARRYEYNTLKADIISYELQRDRLSQKLENTIDINKIQRYALEDLGMVYRDKDNTVKLNVDRK